MEKLLYSVRMRASLHGRHLAGAERIVSAGQVSVVTAQLMSRALKGAQPGATEIHCNAEQIDSSTAQEKTLPDLQGYQVQNWQAGRLLAVRLLKGAGVNETFAQGAIDLLADGAGPDGQVMRGAVIMDVKNGERLEQDSARGVRVSRMDLDESSRAGIEAELATKGLGHYRVREALALAGKVLSAPGIVAELCWSDAPDYQVGYVSDPRHGYQRISALKPLGDERGGRVFFVDSSAASYADLVDYLERQPILFNALGQINPTMAWDENDA